MMPQREPYGEWPASGEIDLMESRGMIIFSIFFMGILDFAILIIIFIIMLQLVSPALTKHMCINKYICN